MASHYEKFRQEVEYRKSVESETFFGSKDIRWENPRIKRELPSKRKFYEFLNGLVVAVFNEMVDQFPGAGEHKYISHKTGQPIKRYHQGLGRNVPLPPNSGRMKAAHEKPGRIHVRGLQSKQGKAGSISFNVNADLVYDPLFQENYFEKLRSNPFTDITHERVTVKTQVLQDPKSLRMPLSKPFSSRQISASGSPSTKAYMREFNKEYRRASHLAVNKERARAAHEAMGYVPGKGRYKGWMLKKEDVKNIVTTTASMAARPNKYYKYDWFAATNLKMQLHQYAAIHKYTPSRLGGKSLEDVMDAADLADRFELFKEAFGADTFNE